MKLFRSYFTGSCVNKSSCFQAPCIINARFQSSRLGPVSEAVVSLCWWKIILNGATSSSGFSSVLPPASSSLMFFCGCGLDGFFRRMEPRDTSVMLWIWRGKTFYTQILSFETFAFCFTRSRTMLIGGCAHWHLQSGTEVQSVELL